MIDKNELQNAIQECLDNPSSANVCQRLASYYIIQDHMDNTMSYSYANENEILPAYSDYANAKRMFQLGEGNEKHMIETLNALLIQIKDLLYMLYSNAVTETEKTSILNTLQELNTGKV